MHISEPYFIDIPQFGNLNLDYVFIEDGRPILFTCKNEKSIYLCIHKSLCPRSLRPEHKWLISETNVDTLRKMTKREFSIKEALKATGGKAVAVRCQDMSCNNGFGIFFSARSIPDSELPSETLFLNEDCCEDALDYVNGLR